MNRNVVHFFRESSSDDAQEGHFHKVIPLHLFPKMKWEEVKEKAPSCPRGWFELSKLTEGDRVEFVRDFWLSKLPFRSGFSQYIPEFFDGLEDIGIYLLQRSFDEPFEIEMIYTQKKDGAFFRGKPSIFPEQFAPIEKEFKGVTFPKDYKDFLSVHDGFCKNSDTGMIPSQKLVEVYESLQAFLTGRDPVFSSKHEVINPRRLVPFYESFGLHNYQCFYADWYPEQEMGNVYFTPGERIVTDAKAENLSFSTFLDWLLFYMKAVEDV